MKDRVIVAIAKNFTQFGLRNFALPYAGTESYTLDDVRERVYRELAEVVEIVCAHIVDKDVFDVITKNIVPNDADHAKVINDIQVKQIENASQFKLID